MPGASIYFGIPLASGAMIICLFLGLAVAVPMALVMAIGFAFIFQNSLEMFIYFLVSSMMAAYWLRNCRERKVFIIAGAKLGLLNIALATAIHLYQGELSTSKLIWDWAFAFMGGIMAGIVTAGLVPLIEIAFDYTTDITLLELAHLDRPIMRRLMIEAPGTYHHSVIVGSLVEAAAAQIGANPLLAKVCGYYHDIGKIKKPLYFIENQTDGRNKHDKLAPSMSSLILIAHSKDGVEIARENKLGQVIIDTIRQHHGTSIIKYFYEKAKQKKGDDAVNIDDFRYPGPKPQTKEAGLVMLADVVEAASRTLDNPTTSRIQGLVQKLINQIFSDGQLDACELTLKDLHNIARSFNKILYGIHHHRIEYGDSRTAGNGNEKGKLKNAGSDRQQARQSQDIKEEAAANGEGHLKRLGLS
jgi:putative nucleotidyltransferase with HDIG domain